MEGGDNLRAERQRTAFVFICLLALAWGSNHGACAAVQPPYFTNVARIGPVLWFDSNPPSVGEHPIILQRSADLSQWVDVSVFRGSQTRSPIRHFSLLTNTIEFFRIRVPSNELRIASQPFHVIATNGDPVSICVGVTDARDLIPKLRFSWTLTRDGVRTTVRSATNACLVITNTAFRDAGLYELMAVGAYYLTNSRSIRLTVEPRSEPSRAPQNIRGRSVLIEGPEGGGFNAWGSKFLFVTSPQGGDYVAVPLLVGKTESGSYSYYTNGLDRAVLNFRDDSVRGGGTADLTFLTTTSGDAYFRHLGGGSMRATFSFQEPAQAP